MAEILTDFEKAIQHNTKGLASLSTGLVPCCAECCQSFGLEEQAMKKRLETGEISDEGHFSWSSCDCCGSSLGGNRYAAHGFDKNGDIIHLDICEDCLCFLANGDLPENWRQR